TLEALANLNETERDSLLLSCDVVLSQFPQTDLNDYAVHMLRCGQRPRFEEDLPSGTPGRVYTEIGEFVGLAEYQKEICRLKALRLMNTAASAA
ncbi:tRNA pseudouridine(55) synthase TruB, partial [Klebsiella pneumoniae]|nr:tRNA pseudouridine(55) synthase TruB [Klebsiella pneumoniae]